MAFQRVSWKTCSVYSRRWDDRLFSQGSQLEEREDRRQPTQRRESRRRKCEWRNERWPINHAISFQISWFWKWVQVILPPLIGNVLDYRTHKWMIQLCFLTNLHCFSSAFPPWFSPLDICWMWYRLYFSFLVWTFMQISFRSTLFATCPFWVTGILASMPH